jgi:hypothetical protein
MATACWAEGMVHTNETKENGEQQQTSMHGLREEGGVWGAAADLGLMGFEEQKRKRDCCSIEFKYQFEFNQQTKIMQRNVCDKHQAIYLFQNTNNVFFCTIFPVKN